MNDSDRERTYFESSYKMAPHDSSDSARQSRALEYIAYQLGELNRRERLKGQPAASKTQNAGSKGQSEDKRFWGR